MDWVRSSRRLFHNLASRGDRAFIFIQPYQFYMLPMDMEGQKTSVRANLRARRVRFFITTI